jgi:Fe-coproporphyrin III synthase
MAYTGSAHVLQIHPTRLCNLRCQHCYSSSSPQERTMLDASVLCGAISDAASEGFTVLGVSGGEPLLYKPLPEVLAHARQLGMRTTVTSNGMLFTERRLRELQPLVHLIAISLDGIPASHNRIRGSERAFETMQTYLPMLRASGIDFGFIFTLTQHNLDELEWVAQFALQEGAKLLQIHPLEEVGYAAQQLRGKTPDATEGAYAWYWGQKIQEQVGPGLTVQVDLAFSDTIKNHPMLQALPLGTTSDTRRFAELVSPLVIEADGAVSPIQYGFAPWFSMGNLQRAPLSALLSQWRTQRWPHFQRLCQQVHTKIADTTEPYFLNWYDVLGREALGVLPVARAVNA